MNKQVNQETKSFNELILQIFAIDTLFLSVGDALTAPLNLTSARWKVLGKIASQPQTVSALANNIGYARQSVQRIANLLVKNGLAEYLPNPQNKRAQLVTLTTQGEEKLLLVHKQQQAWIKRLMKALDPKIVEAMTNQLKDIFYVIQEDYIRELKNVKGGEHNDRRTK